MVGQTLVLHYSAAALRVIPKCIAPGVHEFLV